MSFYIRLLTGVLLICVGTVGRADTQSTTPALMPLPATIEYQRGALRLPATLTHSINASVSPRLSAALQRFRTAVERQTGISLQTDARLSRPLLDFRIVQAATAMPALDTDESYTLVIDPNGITLGAESVFGAMRGLQTLRQLIREVDGGLELPLLRIHDRPRFRWRGMLLDTARHFMPVNTVKRLLDAMEMVKLNVLHLHLSDDQGFRAESAALPELHRQGSNGQYYSRQHIAALVAYAADRGIRVVPEFGLPGHSTSWQIGYPWLAAAESAPTKTGVHEGLFSAPIDPTAESTYELIGTLIADMTPLFPDRYWHIGGDEVDDSAWQQNADIQRFMQEHDIGDSAELQAYFTQRYVALLEEQGKTAIGWQEILHPDIPQRTALQLWMGESFDPALLRHPLVTSLNYYLDHQQPAAFMYRRDPTAIPLDDGEQVVEDRNLLGATIANWTETVTAATIDLRTWPRSAAVAELLWSPREVVATTTDADLYRRLEAVDRRLQLAGIQHRTQAQDAWQRLAAAGDVEALTVLAKVLEPAGLHMMRGRAATARLLMTYLGMGDYPISDGDRLVESLPAESLQARQFTALVERYLAGETELSYELELQLHGWANNHERLASTIAASAPLRDAGIDEVSLALQEVANIGITAMRWLMDGYRPGWLERWRLQAQLDDHGYRVTDLNSRSGLRALLTSQIRSDALARHHIAIQPAVKQLLRAAIEQ